MARFKLRKALLHWRHRKLTLSFRTLVTVVFQERIDAVTRARGGACLPAGLAATSRFLTPTRRAVWQATETKVAADGRLGAMSAEMGAAVAARQKAEAAKRKSEEMLTKELALKKEGEVRAAAAAAAAAAAPASALTRTRPLDARAGGGTRFPAAAACRGRALRGRPGRARRGGRSAASRHEGEGRAATDGPAS